MSRVGVPLGIAVANTPLGKMKLPMRLASKMWALVNDRRALKVRVCVGTVDRSVHYMFCRLCSQQKKIVLKK